MMINSAVRDYSTGPTPKKPYGELEQRDIRGLHPSCAHSGGAVEVLTRTTFVDLDVAGRSAGTLARNRS
jgi:hypothetical protein